MTLFKRFTYAVICASLLTAALGAQPVFAASIVVNSAADSVVVDGACTLREAITNANGDNQSGSTDCAAGAGADTITFAGNYTITLVGSQLPAVTSQITITGNGAANTIIQASTCNPVTLPGGCTPATYRVFQVTSSGNLTLDGLTVRHGRCNGSCTLPSTSGGGGIFNQGTLTVTDSAISDNSATGYGGGVFNLGNLTVTNSTLSGNSAIWGGGINNSRTLTVTNSTLSGNSAGNTGGGIDNGSTLTVANSTLSGNSAGDDGGGIYNDGFLSLVSVTNSTLSGNSATNGGGIFGMMSTLNYSNTIIANSTGGDCFSSIGTNVNNLVEDGSCSAGLSGDPNLGPLADNGGPTQTHALQSTSPAIDAGNAATCAAAPVSNLDQRGVTRPQGAVCDIGAYESDTTFPTVVFTNLIASYAAGAGPSNFTINYSENVFDPAGNTNPNDVTNPINYLLVEDGANNTFNTVSCAGGLAGDDTQVTVTGVTYNAGLFTATVTLSGPVPDGNYRLFVCGTTSIADLSLNELNNGLSDYTFNFVVGTAATTTTPSVTASSLPTTGFAPHKVTQLPAQPAKLAYAALGDLWLEIPSQNIKSNIVGVPQADDNTWDVTWLGNDTGWLNGSAFPTWNGNSVLTAHVTNASGLSGPFANLKDLKYGDQIIVHLSGQKYIYEVQDSRMTRPYSTSFAFQSMQDHSYLTLITCQGYIPFSNAYFFRRIVRAVLVEVK
ncbi:MAG: sortase [Anaerolineales bacterium]|nr:MAG: sortase [Anaerolineales bacterium]